MLGRRAIVGQFPNEGAARKDSLAFGFAVPFDQKRGGAVSLSVGAKAPCPACALFGERLRRDPLAHKGRE